MTEAKSPLQLRRSCTMRYDSCLATSLSCSRETQPLGIPTESVRTPGLFSMVLSQPSSERIGVPRGHRGSTSVKSISIHRICRNGILCHCLRHVAITVMSKLPVEGGERTRNKIFGPMFSASTPPPNRWAHKRNTHPRLDSTVRRGPQYFGHRMMPSCVAE